MPLVTKLMEELAEACDAQRVLCLLAEHPEDPSCVPVDGGPGSGTLITIEREVLRGLDSVKRQWQRRPANGAYGQLLRDVATRGHVDLYTKTMPASVLRTIYETQGVTRSYVGTLGHDGIHTQRYLSVQWTTKATDSMQRYQTMIGMALRLELRGHTP